MKCAILQLNVRAGDIDANLSSLLSAVRAAAAGGIELCVSSAMVLCGSPARALLAHEGFLDALAQAERRLAVELAAIPNAPALIVGSVGKMGMSDTHRSVVPQALLFDYGRLVARHSGVGFFSVRGTGLLVYVGADVEDVAPVAATPDLAAHSSAGPQPVDGLVHLAAMPFYPASRSSYEGSLRAAARRCACPVLSVNQIGGNDGLIFDGGSVLLTRSGDLVTRARRWEEDLVFVEAFTPGQTPHTLPHTQSAASEASPKISPTPAGLAADPNAWPNVWPDIWPDIWQALVLGTRDYARKCGLRRAVLGLSGGVDSALVAAIACAALGPDQVVGLLMPSPWSSEHSLTDAHESARLLGMRTHIVPIAPGMEAFSTMLEPVLSAAPSTPGPDLTQENIQARIRGLLLMAYANKYGALLLTTGNKSEVAVGYCTLYGDTCGGLAPIADLFKTEVYRLCDWLNHTCGLRIPVHTLTKVPSAELRPDQTDQDSLPPYEQLDAILDGLLVKRLPQRIVCAQGHDPAIVAKVAALIAGSEFKRHQLPPAIKLSTHALGLSRPPVTARHPVLW